MTEGSALSYPDLEALPPDLYAVYLAHLRARGLAATGKVVCPIVLAGRCVLRAGSSAAKERAQAVFAEVLAAD